MNRRIRNVLAGMMLAAVMTIAAVFPAFAARIAFSDPSVTAGDEFSVTMKITGSNGETIGSADVMLSYDSTALEFVSGTGAEGGAGSVRVTGTAENAGNTELAFELRFRSLKAGTSQITISTQEVYDQDSQLVTIDREGNSTVTAASRSTDSGDATLSDLQISPGNLSPSFSPDVENYTATVGGDVERVAVSAPPANSSASVEISGYEGLQIGENTVVCTVTAQDGQTVKTYTIQVTKVEGTVDGTAVPEEAVELKTPERVITVLPVEADLEIPEGFESCTVSIDGRDVEGFVWAAEEEPQYCVFYAMNENGETGFYRYDLTEKTLQRYFTDPAGVQSNEQYASLAAEYNSLLKDYNMRFWIIIGLIALSVILLIVVIALVATRGPKDDFFERDGDRQTYPERAASQHRQGAEKEKGRRISREERYMKDLEAEEEEAAQEEEAYYSEETQSRQPEPPAAEEDRKKKSSSQDDGGDDGDFEYVDLGL